MILSATVCLQQRRTRSVWVLITVTATPKGRMATHTDLTADPADEAAAVAEARALAGVLVEGRRAS